MSRLGTIDWIACLAYLGVIAALALWSVRGQRDNDDYFLGGRRMNWFAVGVSMFATSFSSISFLGLPQRGAYLDWLGGRQLPLAAGRALTAVLGALVIVAALLAPRLGDNVIDIINTIAGTLLGGLMAVFLLGMFTRRTNTPGVLAGLATGVACLLIAIGWTGVPKWWYGAFMIFPTLLIGATVSWFFPPPPREALDATTWKPPARDGENEPT